jgi:hypothetical protein
MSRRVLITGSRAWTDLLTIRGALREVWGDGTAVLVSGACPQGADCLAEQVWRQWGGHVQRHLADWVTVRAIGRVPTQRRDGDRRHPHPPLPALTLTRSSSDRWSELGPTTTCVRQTVQQTSYKVDWNHALRGVQVRRIVAGSSGDNDPRTNTQSGPDRAGLQLAHLVGNHAQPWERNDHQIRRAGHGIS